MLDLLSFLDAQCIKDAHQTLGAEQAQKVVLQRDIKTGFAGVALTPGTASKLIIDPARLMALRADDL